MDVAPELRGADAEAEVRREILGEGVDGVEGGGIALAQQRVVALDDFAFGIVQRGDVGIVQPKVVEWRAEVGDKLAGMCAVQLADGSGEERDVAQGVPAAEDEPPFPRVQAPGICRGANGGRSTPFPEDHRTQSDFRDCAIPNPLNRGTHGKGITKTRGTAAKPMPRLAHHHVVLGNS